MTDRISDETLHRLLRAAHIYDAWQADLTSALRELQERRKLDISASELAAIYRKHQEDTMQAIGADLKQALETGYVGKP